MSDKEDEDKQDGFGEYQSMSVAHIVDKYDTSITRDFEAFMQNEQLEETLMRFGLFTDLAEAMGDDDVMYNSFMGLLSRFDMGTMQFALMAELLNRFARTHGHDDINAFMEAQADVYRDSPFFDVDGLF
jgi:hypothetical protein